MKKIIMLSCLNAPMMIINRIQINNNYRCLRDKHIFPCNYKCVFYSGIILYYLNNLSPMTFISNSGKYIIITIVIYYFFYINRCDTR